MKQRIISGLVGALLLATILFFYDSIVLNIAVGIIAVLANYELLVATKYVDNKALSLVSLVFSFAVPFFRTPYFTVASKTACCIFVFTLFILMLIKYESIRIEQVGFVFMISTVFPFALSSMIYVRNLYSLDGLFYIFLILVGAWISDMGAFFVGTFLGKHKLAPQISPKKTIEGAIGGIVICMTAFLVSGYVYQSFYLKGLAHINYVALLCIGIISSVASIVGDLSASLIKRTCNIKDFGNIMPGHGGVLDRFDSILFVAPLFYILVQVFPIIIR